MDINIQQAEVIRRRRRPALSCLACRRKKVSCDRTQPCRRCIAAGSQCTYRSYPGIQHAGQGSSGAHKTANAATEPLPAREAISKTSLSERSSLNHVAEPVNDVETASAIRMRDLEENIRRLNEQVQQLRDISTRFQDPNEETRVSNSSIDRLSTALHKTKFSRLSHWVATPPEFSNIIRFFKATALFKQLVGKNEGAALEDPAISLLVEETVTLSEKCKYLARNIKIGRPSRLESPLWLDVAPPARDIADALVSTYFKYFESAYRILHVPTFWRDYERYWSDPDAATVAMALRLEINLVAAIGSSVVDHSDKTAESRKKAYEAVYAAQMWLSGPLEKHRLNLKAIQIHCLTMLARQIFGIGGDLVWTSMGQLIHEAMQMGLHRDPKHLPDMNLFQSELRRRLWATILEMAVQSSFDSEMPARISLEDYDTEPPSNINDNEMDDLSTEPYSQPRHTLTTMSASLLLLDSLPARLRVVQLLSGRSSELSYEKCLELSGNIVEACGSLSVLNPETHQDVSLFHRSFTDYLIRRFLLYLHGPFSCNASTNPMFSYSRKVCVDAAMAIMSPEQDETFTQLMLTSGGIFKTGIRYAGVAIGVELIAQCRAQLSDLTLSRNAEYRDVLKREVKRLIHLSEERIRHGESNVKNHTFLSMILAEAESIEQNTRTELAIAQSARDSLVFCHELLLAQRDSTPTSQTLDIDFSNFGADFTDYEFDFNVDDFLQGSVFS